MAVGESGSSPSVVITTAYLLRNKSKQLQEYYMLTSDGGSLILLQYVVFNLFGQSPFSSHTISLFNFVSTLRLSQIEDIQVESEYFNVKSKTKALAPG